MTSRLKGLLSVMVLMMAITGDAESQAGGAGLGLALVGGATSYDLAGTGTGAVAAARVEIGVVRGLIIEPGVGYFRYDTQGATRANYLLPELSLQFDPLTGVMRPYVGVGGGSAVALSGGAGSAVSLHAAAGLRVRVTSVWAVKGELRVRSVDPFHGTTADYTGGVSIRI